MALPHGQFRLGPHTGRLLLRTGRQGVASKVGHDLTIEVTDWLAQVNVPSDTPEDATVTARVEMGSLRVREGTGGVKPLSDKDRQEIETNARKILEVDHHPAAAFESSQISVDGAGWTVKGSLTIRGVAVPVELTVREEAPQSYRGTGVIVQTAYGIKPYSAFLGALKLRDEVEMEFEVDLAKVE
ncbi:YceI family protein [Actinopolymorpha alba]|uniref:YceI family protein n=1 Tax=Actinopolymorpha alba TaxID=533267 RepID=UPI00036BFCF6|nr:YceI family protein [Actinopolymorpha alba]